MPLESLDRTPPPFFKQGPSALSKLVFFSALALFLMAADARLKILNPVRAGIATALYPLQKAALQPIDWARTASQYLGELQSAQQSEAQALKKLVAQAGRAAEVEQLTLENARLRKLLDMRERLPVTGQAAEVLYTAPDPYTRKLIIDKGQAQGVAAGAPVIDESGVLGQVTRVYPLVSEVTLLIDRDQATPVMNTRTGVRGVAYGDPTTQDGALELRYMPANADLQPGDLLTTSGIDGVYPPGLPVATLDKIERRADTAFVRIRCTPKAQVLGTRHLLVLQPTTDTLPLKPAPEPTPPVSSKPPIRNKGAAR